VGYGKKNCSAGHGGKSAGQGQSRYSKPAFPGSGGLRHLFSRWHSLQIPESYLGRGDIKFEGFELLHTRLAGKYVRFDKFQLVLRTLMEKEALERLFTRVIAVRLVHVRAENLRYFHV
jgi:hypothetical protein